MNELRVIITLVDRVVGYHSYLLRVECWRPIHYRWVVVRLCYKLEVWESVNAVLSYDFVISRNLQDNVARWQNAFTLIIRGDQLIILIINSDAEVVSVYLTANKHHALSLNSRAPSWLNNSDARNWTCDYLFQPVWVWCIILSIRSLIHEEAVVL